MYVNAYTQECGAPLHGNFAFHVSICAMVHTVSQVICIVCSTVWRTEADYEFLLGQPPVSSAANSFC